MLIRSAMPVKPAVSASSLSKAVENRPQAESASRKPKLLDRLREALRSRHYSRRTEQTY